MPAFVDLKNMIIQTLRAHLHLGDAQVAQPGQFAGRDFVGAGFDDQSHVAMRGGFVEGLGGGQVALTRTPSPGGRGELPSPLGGRVGDED